MIRVLLWAILFSAAVFATPKKGAKPVGSTRAPALQVHEDICGALATEFQNGLDTLAKSSAWEKPFCKANPTAKNLFSETIAGNVSALQAAEDNYCNISPVWRLCFVCYTLSKIPEDKSIENCDLFVQPDDRPYIQTFSGQIKTATR